MAYESCVFSQNKYNLAAETQLVVKIEDENDNKPNFQEGLVGTVLENEPIGTSVMRVRAYDLDGTSPNNKVKPLSCYSVFEQSRKVQMLCSSMLLYTSLSFIPIIFPVHCSHLMHGAFLFLLVCMYFRYVGIAALSKQSQAEFCPQKNVR